MQTHALLVLVAVSLAACSSEGVDGGSSSPSTAPSGGPPSTCVERRDLTDTAYVDGGDPLQALDLHQPDVDGCTEVPLVVWVHGGGWTIGDKGSSTTDKVRLWNGAGWAVASVNYRLTDLQDTVGERLMAPAHDEDVAAAVAWLIGHAGDLGIDADHVALVGHSAGAAIVATLASDPTYLGAHDLEPADLGCVAPLDTEGYDIATVADGSGQIAELYQGVFGTDPDAWDELSPATHVGEAPIPALFLVARGTAVRRAETAAFADATRAAGADVTVVDLTGFTHADVNKRIGLATDHVLTPALQSFLTTCLDG